jgi:hypothetical protein
MNGVTPDIDIPVMGQSPTVKESAELDYAGTGLAAVLRAAHLIF